MIKFPCKICLKSVHSNHKAIQCDNCDNWIHIKCNKLESVDYELLKGKNLPWFCISCNECIFPFGNLTDQQFFIHAKNININFETPSVLNISPPKHLQSIFNEFNNTSNNNNDEEFSINCKLYYDVESFNTSKFKSKDYFSIFHLNIASLSKHKTDLETLLALLNFEFNIIAITETKILKNCQPTFDLTLQNYIYLISNTNRIKLRRCYPLYFK